MENYIKFTEFMGSKKLFYGEHYYIDSVSQETWYPDTVSYGISLKSPESRNLQNFLKLKYS